MTNVTGVVLLDKPAGISSFKALGPVKRAAGTRKVGHTGTLDPFASGLMVVLLGPLTRLAPLFAGMQKQYRAVVAFGTETDTGDPTGGIVREAELPALDTIRAAMQSLTGTISQEPPAYSAVHIEGRRAYELARKGTAVRVPSRKVTIERFELLSWRPPLLEVRVRCSSGTYIRSLSQDLGRACGSAAHTLELRREGVGPFSLDDPAATTPDGMDPQHHIIGARDALERIDGVGLRELPAGLESAVDVGTPPQRLALSPPLDEDGLFALFSADGSLRAVVERLNGQVSYRFVVPRRA